jgi:hypothetical protein
VPEVLADSLLDVVVASLWEMRREALIENGFSWAARQKNPSEYELFLNLPPPGDCSSNHTDSSGLECAVQQI